MYFLCLTEKSLLNERARGFRNKMADISPDVFYGNNRHKPKAEDPKININFHQKLRKIEESSKVFKERPLVQIKKEGLSEQHHIWQTFSTQSQALDYAEKCKKSIEDRVFVVSHELSSDGKRQFVVTSFQEFWRRYQKIPKQKRNFYEVIEEGQLCRLYFDLEFYKNENPNLNGFSLLDMLINIVCFYLLRKFNIHCSRGNIMDLDSSTEDKFSRHLIFHLPQAIFANNIECGNFVKYVYEMARRKTMQNGEEELKGLRPMEIDLQEETLPPDGVNVRELFVNNKDGKKTFFADLGVYTKNRNFRLYGSSKFGKEANLMISKENGFHGSFKRNKKFKNELFDVEYLIFLDTLVCFYGKLNDDMQILQFGNVNSRPGRHNAHSKEGKTFVLHGEVICRICDSYC